MCTIVRFRYRCGHTAVTIFQCPRIGELNQRRALTFLVHGCGWRITSLDEACRECEAAHPERFARPPPPVEEAQRTPSPHPSQYSFSTDSENIDPDQRYESPPSDDSLDGANNEPPAPARRPLGEISLNLI